MAENINISKVYLFFARITGMENKQEKQMLDDYLGEHPEIIPLGESLSDYSNYLERQEKLKWVDAEKNLAAIMVSRRRKWRSVFRYAAILLVPLFAAGAALYIFNDNDKAGPSQIDMSVLGGSGGVVLRLGDGSEHRLEEDMSTLSRLSQLNIAIDPEGLDYRHAVADGQTIYNTITIGRGSEYVLTLNDGTKVWMNSQSELHYPMTFAGDERRVRLSGEAYFDVSHDPAKPFVVEVDKGFDVTVLGTRFNIKAYDSDMYYETTLAEGSVLVDNRADGKKVVLTPSRQLRIGKDGRSEVLSVNAAYYIAWHEGWFYFDNRPLEQVLNSVGRWYDVDFQIMNDELGKIPVTGKFKRFEALNIILDFMRTVTDAQIGFDGKTITVG